MRALAELTLTMLQARLTDEGKIDSRCEGADRGRTDRGQSQVGWSSGITQRPRRPDTLGELPGDVAEWLRSGLQSRLHRFDSGRRLYALESSRELSPPPCARYQGE